MKKNVKNMKLSVIDAIEEIQAAESPQQEEQQINIEPMAEKKELLTLSAMPYGKFIIRVKGASVGSPFLGDPNSEAVQNVLKFAGNLEIVAAEDVATLDNGQELISKILDLPFCATCG